MCVSIAQIIPVSMTTVIVEYSKFGRFTRILLRTIYLINKMNTTTFARERKFLVMKNAITSIVC